MSAAAVNLINTGTLETEEGEGWIELRGSKKVNSRQTVRVRGEIQYVIIPGFREEVEEQEEDRQGEVQ